MDVHPSKKGFPTLRIVQTAGQKQLVSAPSGLSHSSPRAKNEAVGIQYRAHGQGPSRSNRENQSYPLRFIIGQMYTFTQRALSGAHVDT